MFKICHSLYIMTRGIEILDFHIIDQFVVIEKSLDTESTKFYETTFFHIPPYGHAPICILFGQHLAHPPAALLRQQCSEGLHSTDIVQSGSFLCFILFISFMPSTSFAQAFAIAFAPGNCTLQHLAHSRGLYMWKRDCTSQQISPGLQFSAKVLPIEAIRQMNISILFIIFTVKMVSIRLFMSSPM